ncbi:CapA family protein [Burkholderia pyrrocinia]|uniref:CapA family protein n=1 Tax=Burkholderia pyrrocinia TaxID=60550 RepID=UPI002AB1DFE1|nr:CapA family protein [Burkholderia pyrrocinia]
MTIDPLRQIPAAPLPSTIADGFTFAAAGDLIGPGRPETPLADPGFEDVCRIFQQADVAVANQEGSIFDIDTFDGYRAAENGGGYPLSDPKVAHDIKAMGIDVVSKANNHATDWGTKGLLATGATLAAAGVAYAGSGPSKSAARAPAFVETPKGRVAVLSAASTFTPMSEAGDADGGISARPGISVLRTTPVNLVTESEMSILHSMATKLGIGTWLDSRAYGDKECLTIGTEVFRVSDQTRLTYEMNPLDQSELLLSIRGAKQVSDFVALAMHAHESETANTNDRRPADFLVTFYRNAIDAGADLIATTGPHQVRGIEIYNGKPIFYGLASLFLELEGGRGPTYDGVQSMGVDPLAYTKAEFTHARFQLPDDWYDSVIAVSEFVDGKVSAIRLYPIRLQRKTGFRLQGQPRPAIGEDAQRILDRLRDDCAHLGADVLIEDGIGVIRCS